MQEQELARVSMDDLGVFLFAYSTMSLKDGFLGKIVDHFENIYLANKDERSNASAISMYSMALFHLFLRC